MKTNNNDGFRGKVSQTVCPQCELETSCDWYRAFLRNYGTIGALERRVF